MLFNTKLKLINPFNEQCLALYKETNSIQLTVYLPPLQHSRSFSVVNFAARAECDFENYLKRLQQQQPDCGVTAGTRGTTEGPAY